MYRTSNAYSVLQAIAVTAGLALIFWSIGLPSLQFADAAAVTSFSDTLSDSTPGATVSHTLEYVATSGVGNDETIVVTFAGAFTGITNIVAADVDLAVNGVDETLAAATSSGTWGVSVSGNDLILTSASDTSIGSTATVTIEVGVAAGGTDRVTSPSVSSPTSYEISVASGSSDSGTTEVVILPSVTVTAAVDTIFTFAVNGVPASTAVGGTYTTGGASSSSTIPFGELTDSVATTAAQELSVSTNAANGFNVTLQVDQQLTSGLADIDGYIDGAFTTTPTAWAAPNGTLGSEDTYGHWGISSDDTTNMALNFNNGADFVSASTSPVTVFSHTGPVNGVGVGQGTTSVIYRAEVSALQEASDSYVATVTYVATPIF